MLQHREEWTNHPHGTVFTETEDSNSDNKYIMIPQLTYPDYSYKKYSLSGPPSAEPTLEPGPPSENPTEKPTSEPDFDALSEPSAPTREDSMG